MSIALKDKNKDERTKHGIGLSFRNLQGQQHAPVGLLSERTFLWVRAEGGIGGSELPITRGVQTEDLSKTHT